MLSNLVAMKTNNPHELRYCCPSCGEDGFHLYYNLKKNVYHCFKCGDKGTRKPERDYSEKALTEMYEVLQGKRDITETEKILILPSCEPVRPGSFAMRYMIRRGVPKAKVCAMGCMTSNDPSFDNRIIFPIYDIDEKVTFFQARALLKSMRPKYLNPVKPKGGALFYNGGKKLVGHNEVFIVEGIFKALRFWEIGVPAIAIFGKEITREQVINIWKCTIKVNIMLDPDAMGFAVKMADEMAAIRLFDSINLYHHPTLAPDDMTADQLREFLERRGCNEILRQRKGRTL